MKFIKKISYVVLIVVLLGAQIAIPDFIPDAEAKTLRTLRQELEELKEKKKKNQEDQKATEEQIANAQNQIAKASEEKEQLQQEIEELTAQIEQLNKDIEEKNKDIKEIISYYQLTATGQDAYLEYVFTATDFTDFIYRMAIAEQLSDYNEQLITDYENLIIENETKKTELSNKIVKLDEKKRELQTKIESLQPILKDQMAGAVSIDEEIKSIEKNISNLEKLGCKEDEDLDACTAGKIVPDTELLRPVVSGYVSSNYAGRTYWLNGKKVTEFHHAVDFAASHGAKIYASASGVVSHIDYRTSCGGNRVYINHIINGKKYTTCYYHMKSYTVKVGQSVTPNTVIGYVGGTKAEYWDRCSTGAHVHFGVAEGHWGNEFSTYSGYIAADINPRKVVNIPPLGSSFNSRTKRY